MERDRQKNEEREALKACEAILEVRRGQERLQRKAHQLEVANSMLL